MIGRVCKLLTRRGCLIEEHGATYFADNDAGDDDARSLAPLQAAACTYSIAFYAYAAQTTQHRIVP